jgi:hypothetical protein
MKLRVTTLFLSAVMLFSVGLPDNKPDWYSGEKPWAEISENGKREIIRLHNGFDLSKKEAIIAAEKRIDPKSAKIGKENFEKVLNKFNVYPFYKKPSQFGPKMILWIPEKGWNSLSGESRRSIMAYASSLYKNWGIGVGRVKGRDIMSDRVLKLD